MQSASSKFFVQTEAWRSSLWRHSRPWPTQNEVKGTMRLEQVSERRKEPGWQDNRTNWRQTFDVGRPSSLKYCSLSSMFYKKKWRVIIFKRWLDYFELCEPCSSTAFNWTKYSTCRRLMAEKTLMQATTRILMQKALPYHVNQKFIEESAPRLVESYE